MWFFFSVEGFYYPFSVFYSAICWIINRIQSLLELNPFYEDYMGIHFGKNGVFISHPPFWLFGLFHLCLDFSFYFGKPFLFPLLYSLDGYVVCVVIISGPYIYTSIYLFPLSVAHYLLSFRRLLICSSLITNLWLNYFFFK